MHACVSYTCMTLPPILTQVQEAKRGIKHWKIQVNRTKPGSMGGYHIYIYIWVHFSLFWWGLGVGKGLTRLAGDAGVICAASPSFGVLDCIKLGLQNGAPCKIPFSKPAQKKMAAKWLFRRGEQPYAGPKQTSRLNGSPPKKVIEPAPLSTFGGSFNAFGY